MTQHSSGPPPLGGGGGGSSVASMESSVVGVGSSMTSMGSSSQRRIEHHPPAPSLALIYREPLGDPAQAARDPAPKQISFDPLWDGCQTLKQDPLRPKPSADPLQIQCGIRRPEEDRACASARADPLPSGAGRSGGSTIRWEPAPKADPPRSGVGSSGRSSVQRGSDAPTQLPLPPGVGSSGWREPAPEQICCDPSWDPAATGSHGPRRRRGGSDVAERGRATAGPKLGPAVPAGLRGSPRPGARCPPSPAASPSPPCAPAPTPPAPAAEPSPSSGTRSPCGHQRVGARHPPPGTRETPGRWGRSEGTLGFGC